uniref:hypothetical protein n=1 Tax=Hyphomonas sp. UBA4494 TaxID=1946631 RepID=UPI0025BF4098
MLKKLLLAGASLLAMTVHAWADPISLGSLIITGFLNTGLGALLPTVSAATIGSTVLAAASIGAGLLSSALGRRKLPRPGDQKSTIRAEEVSEYNGIGRAEAPTVLFYGNSNGKFIYRLFGHVRGEIDYVEGYYINGQEVVVHTDGKVLTPPFGDPPTFGEDGGAGGINTRVTLKEKDGSDSDTAWSDLTAAFPTLWTANHTVPGIAQTLMIISSPGIADDPEEYQKLFSNGPELELIKLMRMPPVYDPRKDSTNGGSGSQRFIDKSTWEWTQNGILNAVAVDARLYGRAQADYDWTLIASEATRAEVAVTVPGGTEQRSRAGGVWAAEGARGDILIDLLDSIGAQRRKSADDKYWFQLIDDAPAAEIAFTDADIYSVSWKPGPDAVERPNIVNLKYYSSERRYKIAEIPLHEISGGSYSGADWSRNEDEIDAYGEKALDLELGLCPSAYQAQRIGRRKFAMERADVGEIVTNMSGWAAWGLLYADITIGGIAQRCEIGAPVANSEAGKVTIPFKVIPTLSAMTAGDYADPSPEVPPIPINSEIATPGAPTEALQITYPDASKEVRVGFSTVSGADRYAPIMREYTAYPNKPEKWQVMNCYPGSTIGWLAEDLAGDPLDFRYMAYNSGSGEASDYGAALEIDDTPGLGVDNTACGPATTSNIVYVAETPSFSFDIEVPELRAAYVQVERSNTGSGGWTQQGSDIKVRPGQIYNF